MEHTYRGRPPEEFDAILHKITTLLRVWPDIERKGLSLLSTSNTINSLSHEPLTRAATAIATYRGFDALMEIVRTLLGLDDELEAKGLSTQGTRHSIHILLEGPVPRAMLEPHSHPNLVQSVDKAPNEVTNAETSTGTIQPSPALPAMNLPLTIGNIPNDATNAEASTGTIQPSPTLPVTNLPLTIGNIPNDATNAEASTGTIRPSPALPATSLPSTMGKVPNEVTNAEASTGTIQPSPALPATSLLSTMGKVPDEVTNAEASTGTIQPPPALPAINIPQIMDKNLIKWKLSKPFETHFNELCPINLLGCKCKCPLKKINLKDPSVYKEKPWLQPTCKAFLEGQCTEEGCNKAHNFLIERRQLASEIRLQDHAWLLERIAAARNERIAATLSKQKA